MAQARDEKRGSRPTQGGMFKDHDCYDTLPNSTRGIATTPILIDCSSDRFMSTESSIVARPIQAETMEMSINLEQPSLLVSKIVIYTKEIGSSVNMGTGARDKQNS